MHPRGRPDVRRSSARSRRRHPKGGYSRSGGTRQGPGHTAIRPLLPALPGCAPPRFRRSSADKPEGWTRPSSRTHPGVINPVKTSRRINCSASSALSPQTRQEPALPTPRARPRRRTHPESPAGPPLESCARQPTRPDRRPAPRPAALVETLPARSAVGKLRHCMRERPPPPQLAPRRCRADARRSRAAESAPALQANPATTQPATRSPASCRSRRPAA